ncbi:MAG: hypothetical protein M3P23_04825 [Actinomycetota bacterium]|nr:hypothetical protein [Actinomycetota bacterium]
MACVSATFSPAKSTRRRSYAEVVKQYADAGVDVLHIAQIGPDQEGFFSFFNDEVRPLLD